MPRYSTIADVLPRSPGVYLASLLPIGVLYVGSSRNIHRRCTAHLAALKSGTHANRHLQALWATEAEPIIRFKVLWQPEGAITRRELEEHEQRYINEYRAAAINIRGAYLPSIPPSPLSNALFDLLPDPL